ncbi:unnamed protein product [Thelazia callipaeda]|uniref:CNH domain-containing protein n=1 Tax=Thelazia callipaeda TaxID=103827 RepID=A0A0N5CZV9_THECL|nr:unnamed protein product [Thelazia callipaeda]
MLSSRQRTTVHVHTNITMTNVKNSTTVKQKSTSLLLGYDQFSNQRISTITSATPKYSRKQLKAVTLQKLVEYLPIKGYNDKSTEVKEMQMTEMELLREVKFPNDTKIIGLAAENGHLYVATNNGKIGVFNSESNKKINEFDIGGKIDAMTINRNTDIIIVNDTDLVSYRDARIYRKINLPFSAKSLSLGTNKAGSEEVIVLGASNDVMFIFSNDLKPIEEIYYANKAKQTCNFAILHMDYYYISCENAILEIMKNGKLKRNLSVRSAGQSSVIWSEVVYENGRVHIVDYLKSTLKTFRYPSC